MAGTEKQYSRNDAQIIRIDGKNCFVEMMNSCFAIHKLLIRFRQYDGNTNKTIRTMDHYMDFEDALGFAEYILTGSLAKNMEIAAQKKIFKGQTVNDYTSYYTKFSGKAYTSHGNTKMYNDLRTQFPELLDNNGQVILSKQLKVQKASRGDYMIVLRSEYGNGKLEETGAVSPSGTPFAWINVPISEVDALGMASMIKASVNAYLSQFYAQFCRKLFPGDHCDVFEAIPGYGKDQGAAANDNLPASRPKQESSSAAAKVSDAVRSTDTIEKTQPNGQAADAHQNKQMPTFPLTVKFVDSSLKQETQTIASITVEAPKKDGSMKQFKLYFRIEDMGDRKSEIAKAIKENRTIPITARTVEKDGYKYCYFVA